MVARAAAPVAGEAPALEPGFSRSLVIEEVGYELWSIFRPFTFTSDTGVAISVPEGFITDLASVPALARSLVPKIGYWSQAAVIHDFLYSRHRDHGSEEFTRKQVDRLFKEGMKILAELYEVPEEGRKTGLIYKAVRMGGLASWETPTEREARLAAHRERNRKMMEFA